MCFLELVYKQVPDFSVVIAANRDEMVERPALPPCQVRPGVWAGVDQIAGGTWLGVNAHGMVVGIANLRSQTPANPKARSRGVLCLDLLAQPNVELTRKVLEDELRRHPYNGFNLLVAHTRQSAVATCVDGELIWADLEPGVHVIGNSRPDSMDDPKVVRGKSLITATASLDTLLPSLLSLCRDHGQRPDGADAICVHGSRHATRSSTILAIHDADPTRYLYLYAEGNPCRSEYEDLSSLLAVSDR